MDKILDNFALKNPLIVALDIDSVDDALAFARETSGKAGALKVGPRLVTRYGAGFISELAKHASVFVDCKFLDIPSTMCSSVRACFDAGATMCTVHSWSGVEALGHLFELEEELSKIRPFKILVVTILTSFTEELLPPTMIKEPISVQVRRLFRLAREVGFTGFVSSPHEVGELHHESPNLFYVTPGVRFADDSNDEQKRVMIPQDAIKNGAKAIVVGRPILQSKNSIESFEKYLSASTQ